MTAALIDIEKDGASCASGGKNSPGTLAKSPFKVLTTTDNSLRMNVNQDVASHDSFSNAATKQGRRMPRPKPLNAAKAKKVQKEQSPERLQLGTPFGVQGVSPLT